MVIFLIVRGDILHNTNEMDSNDSLIKRYREGDKQALNELIENNQGLVHHALKSFKWAYNSHPKYDEIISYDDFFQEGVMGLYSCVDGYDPEKGAFSTYASWWIRQAIYRFYYNNSRVVRVPYTPHKRMSDIKKAELKYIQEYEKEPSLGELSLYMGIPIVDIQETKQIFENTVSMDAPLPGSIDITYSDVIEDKTDFMEEVEVRLTRESLKKDLQRMAEISIKDKKKIKLMFTHFEELDKKLINDIVADSGISRGQYNVILNDCINKMSRLYTDELIEGYSDLITCHVRRSDTRDMLSDNNLRIVRLMVKRLARIGYNVTILKALKENADKTSVQATIMAKENTGFILKLLSKDHDKTIRERRFILKYEDIIDYRTEKGHVVEIGCIKGVDS